jgi:translation initiation factor 2D
VVILVASSHCTPSPGKGLMITRFDPSHPGIENHAPHVTLAEEDIKVAKRAAREATVTDGPIPGTTKQGKSKELVIEELWKPSGVE